MMELWSGVVSNNAAKVRIALTEKGLSYITREVPWTKETQWDPKPEAFLAVSPRGEVPVLIDDGFAVHDSTVIIEYLEEKYPDVALFPASCMARAQCRIWEDEGDFNQKHVGVLISDVFLQPEGTPLSDAALAAMGALSGFVDRVEGQLEGKDYLCGNFSVADSSVFLTLFFAQTLGLEITQPRVLAWCQRMISRPAVGQEIASIGAAVAAL
jgi:glutathione S-transferase